MSERMTAAHSQQQQRHQQVFDERHPAIQQRRYYTAENGSSHLIVIKVSKPIYNFILVLFKVECWNPECIVSLSSN